MPLHLGPRTQLVASPGVSTQLLSESGADTQTPPPTPPTGLPRFHLGEFVAFPQPRFILALAVAQRASPTLRPGDCCASLHCPSPGSPLSSNFFFPSSLNFSHPSARLLHSKQPIGGCHSRRGSAPCPLGSNPGRGSRELGLVPQRLACDGNAPGAARREGAGLGMRNRRGRGRGWGRAEGEGGKRRGGGCGGFESGSFLAAPAGVGLAAPAPQRLRSIRRRVCARLCAPPTDFSRSGFSPLALPAPQLCLSRRSGEEPGGPPSAVTPPEAPLEPPGDHLLPPTPA